MITELNKLSQLIITSTDFPKKYTDYYCVKVELTSSWQYTNEFILTCSNLTGTGK